MGGAGPDGEGFVLQLILKVIGSHTELEQERDMIQVTVSSLAARLSVLVSCSGCNKQPQTRRLNNRNLFSVSEPGSLRSRCRPGWPLLEGSEDRLSHTSLLDSGGFLGLQRYHSDLCLHLPMVFSLWACL